MYNAKHHSKARLKDRTPLLYSSSPAITINFAAFYDGINLLPPASSPLRRRRSFFLLPFAVLPHSDVAPSDRRNFREMDSANAKCVVAIVSLQFTHCAQVQVVFPMVEDDEAHTYVQSFINPRHFNKKLECQM